MSMEVPSDSVRKGWVHADERAAMRFQVVIVAAILAASTIAAYWGVTGCKFVDYDDRGYVTANRHVWGGLTWEGVKWASTAVHSSNWHPITWMSHMLDVSLFGMRAGRHHLVNLLFHVLNTLLLFGFLKYTTRRLWASAFVAGLFALHPIHVESVAWIAERKDVLSTFFWMATMWMYAFYARRPGPARYAGVVVLLAMGLMSKPMLVTLPVVLLLLDYWPLQRFDVMRRGWKLDVTGERPWRLILEKVPLAGLACCSIAMTLVAQRSAMFPYELMDWPSRMTNAIVSYWRYIQTMIWPEGLAVMYLHPVKPIYGEAAAVLLLLVAVTIGVLVFGTKRKYLFVGWFWYIITLVPVLGLVQVGIQSHADRYAYVPLTGLFIIIAWMAGEVVERHRSLLKPVTGAAIFILIALSIVTWRQVGFWKDSGTLFGRAVNVTKDNYRMMSNLGSYLISIGELDKAMVEFRKAQAIGPADIYTLNGIATVMSHRGQYEEAAKYYAAALAVKPEFEEGQFNLGLTLSMLGKLAEAEGHYRKAVELNPEWAEAWSLLGQTLANMGRLDEGAVALKKAISLNPELADAHFGLGGVYSRKGDLPAAVAELRRASELSPEHRTLRNLGVSLEMMGKHEEAEKVFRRTIAIDPNNSISRMDLAVTLRAMGRKEDAMAEVRKAMELEPQNEKIQAYYRDLTGGAK